MAQFKVGQRVRVVRADNSLWSYLVGHEGVIVRPATLLDWLVHVPGCPHRADVPPTVPAEHFLLDSDELAPLTPPADDAWATEAVRKVTQPQHMEPVKTPAGNFVLIWS